jgi:hypothetical protein
MGLCGGLNGLRDALGQCSRRQSAIVREALKALIELNRERAGLLFIF